MAKKKSTHKSVEHIKHPEESRKNIPTVEYQSMVSDEVKEPVQVAYERRNRDLDPQLVWRGKDEQDWTDLVVQAPPLYIQDEIRPTGDYFSGFCCHIDPYRRIPKCVGKLLPSPCWTLSSGKNH